MLNSVRHTKTRTDKTNHQVAQQASVGPNGLAINPQKTDGLPSTLKNGVEALSGFSMDDVRVHTNSSKPARLGALAYAQGSDIHLAPGQERHLPHETWHVVQQKQKRVQPTAQIAGAGINSNDKLEYEASVMGKKAVQAGGLPQKDRRGGYSTSEVAKTVHQPQATTTPDVIQCYKNKFYQPNLSGLVVPVSKFDTQKYNQTTFENKRPSGWYDNTFDVLFEMAEKITISDPFNDGRLITLVKCAVTGQPCTVDALDIGHKTNWQTFIANAQPETMREAINAYNDIDNLRLESASANRSHDFELSNSSNFKDLPDIDDFGSGKTGKEKQQRFIEEQYTGIDIDSYDLTDPFIDDSNVQEQTFVTRQKIWLTDLGGLNSGAGEWFGETTVILSENVRGRYMEVTILHTTDFGLKRYEGQKLWGNLRNLRNGDVVTY